ncbi:MAG: hypothetical protein QX190_05315 [Methylococcales bacterium]
MKNEPSQLNTDLAAMLGFAAGNRTKASEAITQAKQGLGIDKLTQSLTADDKAAIIQWHKARLTDDNQLDIESITPLVAINEPIETTPVFDNLEAGEPAPAIIEQVETIPPAIVETIADDTAAPVVEKALELINAPLSELELLRIENAKLQAQLEAVNHKAAPTYTFNETVRIAFYIGDKRQIIALSGFYLNALMLSAGIDKKGIPAWIKTAVDSWGAFDDKLNVTEQIKLLIVRELESELKKARG